MATRAIPREEAAGLALAVALHAGLLALLVLQPAARPLVPPPERISVILAEDAALTSISPDPQAQAAPPAAPKIAPQAEPEPAPEPAPQPARRPEPVPRIKPDPVVMPKPQVSPAARPVARPLPKPQPRIIPSPAPRLVAKPQPAPAARPQPAATPRAATRPAAGASRISNDFLKGVPAAQAPGPARNPPAAVIGPQVRASFAQSVLRQVKPNWQGRVPQGVNTEMLITILSIELNRDGTLAGLPRIIGQEGIDDSNRAQAQRHAEAAIRAVQLSQPFKLPPEQYEGWKRLPPLRFRKST